MCVHIIMGSCYIKLELHMEAFPKTRNQGPDQDPWVFA